jgi:hypothetical protein
VRIAQYPNDKSTALVKLSDAFTVARELQLMVLARRFLGGHRSDLQHVALLA